jgi:hypothetical protein
LSRQFRAAHDMVVGVNLDFHDFLLVVGRAADDGSFFKP